MDGRTDEDKLRRNTQLHRSMRAHIFIFVNDDDDPFDLALRGNVECTELFGRRCMIMCHGRRERRDKSKFWREVETSSELICSTCPRVGPTWFPGNISRKVKSSTVLLRSSQSDILIAKLQIESRKH
ncbi:unnamed protein product [Allacma fusca]|uniref:Uncharacterized protein n=1 Tax=Allacma fusca TaxID=39272 RepID=A0A8J2KK41_9HEXA|nr:unnamed protein product [Allacma fusca]